MLFRRFFILICLLSFPPYQNFAETCRESSVYTSLDTARLSQVEASDVILLRDFSRWASPQVASLSQAPGKWHLRAYQLENGERGNLLVINDRVKNDLSGAVPPVLHIPLDLPGWYSIELGFACLEDLPHGVDVALDNDPGFFTASCGWGIRKGKTMGPSDKEVMMYWKCAPLKDRTLRIRVPFGTSRSLPWGLVSGGICSIRLKKLSNEQIAEYQNDAADPTTKKVILIDDGFSRLHEAVPGSGIYEGLFMFCPDSDIKMLIHQTPATGVACWPSRVTSLLGETVSNDLWPKLREGDRRACEYIKWSVEKGRESFKVLSTLCRQSKVEFHAGLRMNLFWGNSPLIEYFNGRWWIEHPSSRKSGGCQLNYAYPQAQEFILELLMELAQNYDIDGISMDFTRWPPVADPGHHEDDVLTSFIVKVKERLNNVEKKKNKKIALSVMVVDKCFTSQSLEEQKIDLEAWLATGILDFICVQAWDIKPYIDLAKKYNTTFYAIQDNDSIRTPHGSRDDPDWSNWNDPQPGEEHQEKPRKFPCLDPTEWQMAARKYYRAGADGVALVNAFMNANFARRLGHIQEIEERCERGEAWGLETGPKIILLPDRQ